MQELNKKIIEWAKEREIDKKGTVEGQKIKTIEETSELIKAICKDKKDDIIDSIGDVWVTQVIGNMLLEDDKKVDLDKIYKKISEIEQINVLPKIMFLQNLAFKIYCEMFLYSNGDVRTTLAVLLSICKCYDLKFEDCVESAYNEIANRKGKMIDGQFVKESDLK